MKYTFGPTTITPNGMLQAGCAYLIREKRKGASTMKIRHANGQIAEVQVLRYFNFYGFKFAVHESCAEWKKEGDGAVTVSEFTTGARIADGGTIGGAIGLAQDNLRYRGRKALAAVIKATREKYGRAN